MQENENVYEPDSEDEEFKDEDFAAIDALIEQIRAVPASESVSVLDTRRAEQMKYAYATIKRILSETKSIAKVTCGQNEFNPSVGFVKVEGISLEITDMEGFSTVAEFADVTEIIPLVKNRVRMEFTFRRLLKTIG